MQNNTLRLRRSALLLSFHFNYACTKASTNDHNTQQNYPDKQLLRLFQYRKSTRNKKKIAPGTQGLAHTIFPLLKKEYNHHSFKKILGGIDPSPTDKHIFLSLQWAYQKGAQQGTRNKANLSLQNAAKNLYQVLSTWRRSTTHISTKIQQMQDALPSQLSALIDTKAYITNKEAKALTYVPS